MKNLIERLQQIEREQRTIIEKQTGEKPHVAKVNSYGKVIVDLLDDKQRRLWR